MSINMINAPSYFRKVITIDKNRAGFSLIEIVLALGIISFALVGILGIFPLALTSARESAAETRISFIAQSLLADIRATDKVIPASSAGASPTRTASIFAGQSPDDLNNTSSYRPLLLHTSDMLFLTFDQNGQCIGEAVSPTDFQNGKNGAVFIARIKSSFSPTAHTGNTHIEIRIEYPAAAPLTNRNVHRFTTLL